MGRSRLSQNGESNWSVLDKCIVKVKRERILLSLEGDPEKEKSGREDGKRIPRGEGYGAREEKFGTRSSSKKALGREGGDTPK